MSEPDDEQLKLMQGSFIARSSLALAVESLGAGMTKCRDASHRIKEGGFLTAYEYIADATAFIGQTERHLHEAREKLAKITCYLEQHHVGDAPPLLGEDEPPEDGH